VSSLRFWILLRPLRFYASPLNDHGAIHMTRSSSGQTDGGIVGKGMSRRLLLLPISHGVCIFPLCLFVMWLY